MLSTLTQTCLSVPQFGSCSSFGTFRPAFSHTGTIRPLSVILPASPTFNHSPGSNTPSPTSKVPSWKVCFHLQFYFFGFSPFLKLCCFFASCVLLPPCTLMSVKINLTVTFFCCCSSITVFQSLLAKMCQTETALSFNTYITYCSLPTSTSTASNQFMSQISSFHV